MASFFQTYRDVARRNSQPKRDSIQNQIESNSQVLQQAIQDFQSIAFAKFMCKMMSFVGFLLFTAGLVVGVYLTAQTNEWGGTFFDRHDLAYIGIPLISSAFTFGLPFAAVGAYMSARLRGMQD
jgi:hypothetical protein